LGANGSAWAFLVPGLVCLAAGLALNYAGNPSKLSKRAVLEVGGSSLVLLILGALLLVVAVARFRRAGREGRRERAAAGARRLTREQLAEARGLVQQLLADEIPAIGQVWDVVLRPGERVLLDARAAYSRFYGSGTPVSHAPARTSPSGSTGDDRMLRRSANRKARKRTAAEEVAWARVPCWREQQQSRVLITDQRLLCEVNAHGWLSFEHKAATAIKALPEAPGVVLEYPGSSPLCLSGPGAARVMVVVVWALYGADGLREHPALAQVRPAAPGRSPATKPTERATRLPGSVEAAESEVSSTDSDLAATEVEPVTTLLASAERPEELLAFLAANELVIAQHAAQLLEISAEEATDRLDALRNQGAVSRVKVSSGSPAAYRITPRAAVHLDPALPALRAAQPTRYRRDLIGAWLWMTARKDRFGQQQTVLSRREMQAADASSRTATLLGATGVTFGEKSSITEPDPDPRYRDLALVQASGSWQSVDVMLSPPGPERLRGMISRAHHDQTLNRQLFLVRQDLQVRELIESIAGELGLADSVAIEPLDPAGITSDAS
jgi:hypothetical protein